MSKIWIKPKHNLFVGDTALQENKVVELPESEANELLKNGWAEIAEKPKNKGKSANPPANPPANQDNDPPANPPASQDNDPPLDPPLNDGESQDLGGQQPENQES